MGNITDYLSKIKTAIYGKDVRGAMHDAIKQVYDDAAQSGNANMEVTLARGTEPNLNARLEKMDEVAETTTAELAQKVNKGDSISVSQIDKNQGKLDQTYMSEEFLQQMAGNTPINAVPADKSITTIKLADGSVTPNTLSKNSSRGIDFKNSALYHGATKMLNPVFELGGVAHEDGRLLTSDARIRTTDFIQLTESLSIKTLNTNYKFLVVSYNLDGTYVSGTQFITGTRHIPLDPSLKYKIAIGKVDNSVMSIGESENIVITAGESFLLNNNDIKIESLTTDIYDGIAIDGGLNPDGTDANTAGYARTSYLPINNGDIITIKDTSGKLMEIYAFLYKQEGTIGERVVDYRYNASETSYTFIINGDYKYLRMNNKSVTYGDYSQTLEILSGQPQSATIKGINLNMLYKNKNESAGTSPYKSRPSTGVVNFIVDVNTDLQLLSTANTLNVQDGENTLQDNGVLFLPDNYEQHGKPLKLVINCHGAGTTITPTSDLSIYPGYMNYLVNGLGYAVLDMNGIPHSLSGSTGLHFGSPIALQAYIKGYEYAIKNYNLDKEVFIIGTSMGGLTSNMLVQSGSIPVKAQGSFCGVVDHFKQAWCNPWNSGQREKISTLFYFEGTSPVFTATGYPTQEEIDYYIANIDKVIGYNPIMKNTFNWNMSNYDNYGNAAEVTGYNGLIKHHPVPLKVWHNDDDGTVLPRYSEYFVKAIRNAGGLAYLRRFPSGGHNAWNNGDIVNTTNFKGNSISIESSAYELGLWFKRFE